MNKKTVYHRLSLAEREEISRSLAAGLNPSTIGRQLHRDKSTISRELSRNGLPGPAYRAFKAHRRWLKTRKQQGRKRLLFINCRLWQYVVEKLKLRWSPEQIVNRLKIEYPGDTAMRISHEAIYRYLYVLPKGKLKKALLACLRQQRKRRYKRGAQAGKQPGIPDLVSITERPEEVESRTIPGHWEGDLLIGRWKRSALGALVERRTRATILVLVRSHHAPDVRRAFAREIQQLPQQLRKTLTYDRGREMVEHKLLTKQTKVKVYFTHPKSPWERGTSENTNGLVRQFFPRKTDFAKISRREVKRVQRLLNQRPRKVLGWKTPEEVFTELLR